jgi:hypothetical protein
MKFWLMFPAFLLDFGYLLVLVYIVKSADILNPTKKYFSTSK